ncbi:MAG: nicotinate phosphoribosyltransferase [Candidatus Micrarchaeia archaeon]
MRKPKLGLATENDIILLTDFYELTMAASYFHNRRNERASFEMFVRKLPANRGFLLAAGLEPVLAFLESARFSQEALSYLDSLKMFDGDFLSFLERFKFRGDVWAVPEGTVVFANEPLLSVSAPRIEAQLIESFVLNALNFQTNIATKAARVVGAARGRPVVEFGLRRAHGVDAGVKGARAAFIGGCVGTSDVLAGKLWGLPVSGTVAHSFIQSFASEREAFRAFAGTFPDNSIFLIDTYDTLAGAEAAAEVAKEMEEKGKRLRGVRLDSGDLLSLSRAVRKILDARGLRYVKIFASGDLNEYIIDRLVRAGAPIDAFGVGTELSTSRDAPALNGIYKLCEDEAGPRMKLSKKKVTLPGRKQVWRRKRGGLFVGDTIGLAGEKLEDEPLLEMVMRGGRLAAELPALAEIQARAKRQLAALPPRYKKLMKPAVYPVRLSDRLKRLVRELSSRLEVRP